MNFNIMENTYPMNNSLRTETELQREDEYTNIAVVGRGAGANDIKAECYVTLYSVGICNIELIKANLVEYAIVITRAALEEVRKLGGASQYFCWGVTCAEWPEILQQILPCNFYFTPRMDIVTAEQASERCKKDQFVIWRGFSEPQHSVIGSLPIDHPALETTLVNRMQDTFWMALSHQQMALLARYFLGRKLSDRKRKSVLKRNGLIDRFEKCVWHQANDGWPLRWAWSMTLISLRDQAIIAVSRRGKRFWL